MRTRMRQVKRPHYKDDDDNDIDVDIEEEEQLYEYNAPSRRLPPSTATTTTTTTTTNTTATTTNATTTNATATTKRTKVTKQPEVYDRDPETNRYIIYSKCHNSLIQGTNFRGHSDFLLTITAFRYEYLAKNVTREMRESILQHIYEQYVFYQLDEAGAKCKIKKSVEDYRYLRAERYTQDAPWIQERTAAWAQTHQPPDYVFVMGSSSSSGNGGNGGDGGGPNQKKTKNRPSTGPRSARHRMVVTKDHHQSTEDDDHSDPDFVPYDDRPMSQYLPEFHRSMIPIKNDTNNNNNRSSNTDTTTTTTNQNTHPYYIEELAYHYYYDQAHAMRKQQQQRQQQQSGPMSLLLEPLPPPPPIPVPPSEFDHPNHTIVTWKYDPTSRIYLVDFSKVPTGTAIPMPQKHFLGALMERDDITVICEGLYDHSAFVNETSMQDFLYDLGENFGAMPYAKFRQFHRIATTTTTVDDGNTNATTNEYVTYEEVDGYLSMNVISDYLPYIEQTVLGRSPSPDAPDDHRKLPPARPKAATTVPANGAVIHMDDDDDDDDDIPLDKVNHTTTTRPTPITPTPTTAATATATAAAAASSTTPMTSSNSCTTDAATDSCIYMTDVEMATYCPRFDYEYKQQFKMKELLPGGTWCLMNHLPEQSRPFMGPNLYISPGGGYTQFHQDGHGTVDSGHSCLNGYNEVVMLRRLPECHKRQACQLIPSTSTMDKNRTGPLGSVATASPKNSCKVACQNQAENVLYRLPHDDNRHDKLTWAQTSTIEEWEKLGYCPSVFILKPGQHLLINKGRLHAFRKLTFDELPENDCHAQLRKELIAELRAKNIHRPPLCISVAFDWSFIGITAEGINRELATTLESAALCRKYSTCKSLAIPETAILRMADSAPIRFDRNKSLQLTHFGSNRTEYVLSWWEIVRGILPSLRYVINRDTAASCDTRSKKIIVNEFPDTHLDEAIDPYGNDYFCNICSHELANTYFHCHGCESLLAKDFNICIGCYNDDAYAINVEMHKFSKTAMSCHLHHVGKPKVHCAHPLTHDMKCTECKKCLLCNCICHTVFQKRSRFYTEDRQRRMLDRCTELVHGCEIKYSFEAECQLYGKPLVSIQEDQTNELPSFETDNLRSTHTDAARIVVDVCQKNQNFAANDTMSENREDNNQQIKLKASSSSVDIIDVDVDNHVVSTDSDSSRSTELLNCNTGEIQNADTMRKRNETEHVGEIHSLTSERVTRMASRSAKVLIESTLSIPHSPYLIPVGSDERVLYDAV